jgi:hypothetical protein
MEHRTSDTHGAAWFLAAVQAQDAPQARDDGSQEPEDGTPPNVIIAVSLDELDGMTGDMLV